MQKYHENRLLYGSNLTILLLGRRQLLHFLRATFLYKNLNTYQFLLHTNQNSRIGNQFLIYLYLSKEEQYYLCILFYTPFKPEHSTIQKN